MSAGSISRCTFGTAVVALGAGLALLMSGAGASAQTTPASHARSARQDVGDQTIVNAVYQPEAAQVSPDSTGWWGANTYVANYSDYLTDPYGGGNGTPVKFDYDVENSTSSWYVSYVGTVSASTFPDSSALQNEYDGDVIVQFESNATSNDYSLGTTEDLAVMRPTGNNYFVEDYLGGTKFQVVSVYATNNWGGGEIAYCLTSEGPSEQAQYAPCGDPGQTLTFSKS